MRIQFCCPACHQPLSVSSCYAGKGIACPTCKENLTIPMQSSLDKGGLLAAAPADTLPRGPSPSGRRRSAVLAGLMVVLVFGLGVVAAMPFFGKDSSSLQAQSKPDGQPKDETDTLAVAQLDKLPNQEKSRASSSAQTQAVSPETEEMTEEGELPALTDPEPARPPLIERAQSPAPGPAERQPKQAGAIPPGPAAKPQPPQPEKKKLTGVRERWASKRRSRLTDDELRLQLVLPPEVDLDAVPGTTNRVIYLSGKTAGTGVDVIPQLVARRADLLGLPLHQGNLARVGPEEALNLKVLSQRLRLQVQTSMPAQVGNVVDPRPDPAILRQRLLNNPLQEAWLRPQAIATLRQLLMHEHRNVRLVFVDILSRIDGRLASVALAERAVFDMDPDVRLAALVALKDRPVQEYQAALIAGLRYPFPAFADHAAEALVALDLRDAVPKLIPLLDARDLDEPYPVDQGKTRRAMVPELVRINHLRNCLLCHAYSASPADPVRGLVPNAEHLVPLPSSAPRTGWGGGGGGSGLSLITPTFVRADINFLRQDFSVLQPVPKHGRLWPADQRFDYLIRLRPLSSKELLSWQDKDKDFRPPEPQRESLLFALRELTGENPGPSRDDWKRLYSTITGRRLERSLEPRDQVLHLKDCLVEGSPLQQAERLTAFRDKSGTAYDTALALAIPQLKPELQKQGRTVLADRFYCLPLKNLGEKLADQDAEFRRAAVSACRQRKLKALVPELIALLDDGNQDVAKLAHELLQQFASRDFGPKRGADREQRMEAMAAWRTWWEKQNEKLAAQNRPRS
jgi:hypothetical protein